MVKTFKNNHFQLFYLLCIYFNIRGLTVIEMQNLGLTHRLPSIGFSRAAMGPKLHFKITCMFDFLDKLGSLSLGIFNL